MAANSAQVPALDSELVSPSSSISEENPAPETKATMEDTSTSHKSVQAYIKSASYAKQEGNLKLVRKILKEGYQSTQQTEILSQWLVIDKTVLQTLEKKHQLNSITEWTSKFEDQCLKKAHTKCSEYEHQKAISLQEENIIAIPQIEDVDATLNKYQQLKNSQIDREAFLDEEFTADEDKGKKTIFEEHNIQVDELKRTRCQYLSFDVISPYLSRTKQLIFMSKINKPEGSSLLTLVSDTSLKKVREIEMLHQAAKILVNVGIKGIIFESDTSVQKQFLNVYEEFKQTEGAKFKEFKEIKKIAEAIKEDRKPISCKDNSLSEI
jgi:hypothetical protein